MADGEKYVVHGMKVKCSEGSMENYINTDKGHGVVYQGQPVLNANDHVKEINLTHFGDCKSKLIFEEAKKQADEKYKAEEGDGFFGRLGKGIAKTVTKAVIDTKEIFASNKCELDTPLPWIFTNRDHMIDGAPALTAESQCPCKFGGIISIVLQEEEAAVEAEEFRQAVVVDAPKVVPKSAAVGKSDTDKIGIPAMVVIAAAAEAKRIEEEKKKKDKKGTGNQVFKGESWLALAEGNIPYIYSTKDLDHNPWTGSFDSSADLTFGIGHSIKTADEFKKIKKFIAEHSVSEIAAEVQRYLQEDLSDAVGIVNNFARENNVNLKQNQFDATVTLVFNVPDALSSGSDLTKALTTGNFDRDLIIKGFTYTKFQGKRIDGLVTRRNNELNLFFHADYTHYYDTKQKVIDARKAYISYP
jgi:GH24 family phage-related lysozyme (muramidase)